MKIESNIIIKIPPYFMKPKCHDFAEPRHPDSNANTIEDAKFPDGIYQVLIKAADHESNWSDTTATNCTTQIHVDNFNPRIKEKRPNDWFAFVPTKEKRVWCVFSEQMDSTTLTATNIKIQSLKADSFNYTITNFIYDDSIYKLTLEVDSFRFKDTVQGINKPEDTLRCRHDSLRTRLRLEACFAEGNFLNYKILNINIKLNRSFNEIICSLDRVYDACTIMQKKGRYEGLKGVIPS